MSSDRRSFLKTAALASAATALGSLPADAAQIARPRDYVELRAYRFKPGTPHTVLDAYLAQALIPALNRRGIRAVGAFTEPEAKDGLAVWLLIPHASLATLQNVTATINVDPAVVAAGREYLQSPTKDNPAFDRIDSWLYHSFSGQPRLVLPALARNRQARVLELRIYESFSELTALKKIEMFNAGEIEVMHRVGLAPVFYGQALVGSDLPHLSYMLCSTDRATHDTNWKAFLDDAVWKRLVADPQYANTVSKITSRFLVPTEFSQI